MRVRRITSKSLPYHLFFFPPEILLSLAQFFLSQDCFLSFVPKHIKLVLPRYIQEPFILSRTQIIQYVSDTYQNLVIYLNTNILCTILHVCRNHPLQQRKVNVFLCQMYLIIMGKWTQQWLQQLMGPSVEHAFLSWQWDQDIFPEA